MGKILIVEDDSDVALLLERGLKEEGHQTKIAGSAEIALRKLCENWDLIILDLMLPGLPGDTVLKHMNQQLFRPPVLVLTARSEVETKLRLFRDGCDDYLSKPFVYEELLARVRALLRRPPRVCPDRCHYEDMVLEDEMLELLIGDKKINLTPKEYAICRILLSEPGKVITRKELLHTVWGYSTEPDTNFIEVHLAYLRKKLKPYGRDKWVQTVKNAGITLSRPH